jgi:hypothetical protein
MGTSSSKKSAYSGAATFGKIYSIYSGIITLIIGIVLIMIGTYIISPKNHLKSTDGIVLDSNCTTSTSYDDKGNPQQHKSCTSRVKFSIDGVDQPEQNITTSKQYADNYPITIYYDPNNISNIEVEPASKTVGWILISIAILMNIMSWGLVILTQKSKEAAAVYGGAEAVGMLSGAFRK